MAVETKSRTAKLSPKDKNIYFLPLGGCEQFGINFNLYAHKGKWLAVDCGIGFADERFPLVDLLLPDPSFLEERLDDLEALIITHAHEDHIGAVPYLWPRLGCPIYCTPFTASVLRTKFQEFKTCRGAGIIEIDGGDTVDLGPFKVGFARVAHSIPQAVSLFIDTSAGLVVHSSDWNLDPKPVIDVPTDPEPFKEAGRKGVLAYVGDSTNAHVPGRSRSESEAEEGLSAVFAEAPGRVAVTIFASNIGRIRSIVRAAEACGRRVCLMGRSLRTMGGLAIKAGYMKGVQNFTDEEDFMDLPPEKQVMIVTGSQGEPRAALARMAAGDWPGIDLGPGDTVVFSSREIPGNELAINVVKNNLCAAGVTVIGARETPHVIHVSGHPRQDEIRDMLEWLRPELVVPVHGERLMLEAHSALAKALGTPRTLVPENGALVRLGPDKPEIVEWIEAGMLAVEPGRILASDDRSIRERRKLQFSGMVHVTLVLDRKGILRDPPMIHTYGLVDEECEQGAAFLEEMVREIEDILADIRDDDRRDDHFVTEEIRIGVRRFVKQALKIKPKASVHVVRV